MSLVLNGNGTIQNLVAGGLPDGSVTADDIASTLDLSGKTVTLPAGTGGKVLQVVSSNFNDTHLASVNASVVTQTTNYASTSLTPIDSVSITPVSSSSYFYVSITGGFSQSNSQRSQILLTRNYTAGTNPYLANDFIWYDHYGMYNNTGGDLYTPGSFSYMDKTQDQTIGVARTYYWFGGTIGGGTQLFRGINVTVMEIAA